MNFQDAIRSAGMMPPETIRLGQFERFPGSGKKKGNTSGWCKLITDTLGIFGDWSSGLSELWSSGSEVQDLSKARDEMRRVQAQQKKQRQEDYAKAARKASMILERCKPGLHEYFVSKGFPEAVGMIDDEDLIIPMRDFKEYSKVISLQRIKVDGSKKFLPGGRAKGAIFKIGTGLEVYLCEGYATGLSISKALTNLYRRYCVIVCFSAGNLTYIARQLSTGVVMADNDSSGTGERAATDSGKPWVMPPDVGMDFNDLHQSKGIAAVERIIRSLPRSPP